MTDTRLDDAIDRTVREMMNVDPGPGLSRRVLARLETPRTPWLTVPQLAAAAALVAVTVVALVLVTRTPAPVSQQVAVTPRPPVAAPPSEEPVPSPSTGRTPPIASIMPPRVRFEPRQPRAAEELPPFVTSARVEPLASMIPIEVPPAGPRALELPEVVVAPLATIEPVRVEPLSSRPH